MSEQGSAVGGPNFPVVADPRRGGQVPWPLYAAGAGAALAAGAGWWAVAGASGPLRIVGWVIGIAAALCGGYSLVLGAGWQVVSTGLGQWFGRHRRADALRTGEHLLELRFGRGSDPEPDFVDDLFDALGDRLGENAECGEIVAQGGAVTYYLHGKDLEGMVAAVRAVTPGFSLPDNSYLWVPDLTRPDYGRILPLRNAAM